MVIELLLATLVVATPHHFDSALSVEQSVVWAENPVPPVTPLEAPKPTLEAMIRGGDVSTSTLALFIEEQAVLEGVNPELALAIARAESNFVWNAKNPVSSASGLWQFINKTFEDYCITKLQIASILAEKNDPILQTKCALAILVEPRGEEHWNASRYGVRGWGTQELVAR